MKLGFVRVYVSEFERAFRYYQRNLGLELDCTDEKEWAQFYIGNQVGLVIEVADPNRTENGSKLVGRFVGADYIDEEFKRLKRRGVEFLGEPEEKPWGSVLVDFKDPDGNVLTIMQTRSPRQMRTNWHSPLDESKSLSFCGKVLHPFDEDSPSSFSLDIYVQDTDSSKVYKVSVDNWVAFKTTVDMIFVDGLQGVYGNVGSCCHTVENSRWLDEVAVSLTVEENQKYVYERYRGRYQHYFIGTRDLGVEFLTATVPTVSEIPPSELPLNWTPAWIKE